MRGVPTKRKRKVERVAGDPTQSLQHEHKHEQQRPYGTRDDIEQLLKSSCLYCYSVIRPGLNYSPATETN